MEVTEFGTLPNHTDQQFAAVGTASLKRRNVDESDEDDSDVVTVSNKIKRMKLPGSARVLVEEEMIDSSDCSNNSNTENFNIQVKTLSGRTIELCINSGIGVFKIKELIEESQGIPADQQRLILKGKTMADQLTATDYDLKPGTTLHLVLALRGGTTLEHTVIVELSTL